MPEITDGEDDRDEVNELSIIATLYDTDNSEVSVFSDSSSSQANGSEADYLNYDSSDDSSSPSWSATSMVAKMSINDHDDNKIKSAVEMNKTEMEAFLGREIEDHQVGVARFEASIKIIENATAMEQQHRCQAYEQGVMDAIMKSGSKSFIATVQAKIPMIMFDSGAYRHIWGTDLINSGLIYDIQDMEIPEEVDTACGEITLTMEGKLKLRSIVFSGALNYNMGISLIAQGKLFGEDKWRITGANSIMTCEPPSHLGVDAFDADMCGTLSGFLATI